jgi:hypothetical protein
VREEFDKKYQRALRAVPEEYLRRGNHLVAKMALVIAVTEGFTPMSLDHRAMMDELNKII